MLVTLEQAKQCLQKWRDAKSAYAGDIKHDTETRKFDSASPMIIEESIAYWEGVVRELALAEIRDGLYNPPEATYPVEYKPGSFKIHWYDTRFTLFWRCYYRLKDVLLRIARIQV